MSHSPAARWPVRTATEDDWPDLHRVDELAFHGPHDPAMREHGRLTLEQDRISLACEPSDGSLVGVAGIYTLDMSVPGGSAPVAGVTWVSVLPTRRRRGVLTALMREQLHGLHDRGQEPVAALWASEPAIYGRFGYGAASRHLALELPRGRSTLSPAPSDDTVALRLLDEEAAASEATLEALEPVYDAVRAVRPGLHARDVRWRRREVFDHPSVRDGGGPLVTVLAERDGVPCGYARYRTKGAWGPDGPSGSVHVREAFASDAAAYAELWRYLTDIDLTSTVSVPHRPLDDPLLELVTDVRRARAGVRDGLFVRLVDVDRALVSRRYAGPVDLVLEVRDGLCPWNDGRWHLQGEGSALGCTRTERAPDLVLPVGALGAAYLGAARSLSRAAGAGLVEEARPGALAAADRAFTGGLEPWASTVW